MYHRDPAGISKILPVYLRSCRCILEIAGVSYKLQVYLRDPEGVSYILQVYHKDPAGVS